MSEFVVHRWDESADGQLTLENMLKKLKSEVLSIILYNNVVAKFVCSLIAGLQLHKLHVQSWHQFSGTYPQRR